MWNFFEKIATLVFANLTTALVIVFLATGVVLIVTGILGSGLGRKFTLRSHRKPIRSSLE